MKKTATVIGVVVFMIVVSLIGRGLGFWAAQTVSGPPEGFVVTRETYNGNCIPEAQKSVTAAQATAYCDCTYTQGVAKFGGEEFTKEMVKLEETNKVTPEINAIVNKCVQGI